MLRERHTVNQAGRSPQEIHCHQYLAIGVATKMFSGVGVNEIEFAGCRPFQERCAVHDLEGDPRVMTEVPLRDSNNICVDVDCHKTGVRIHTREQPGGSNSRADAEFKEVAFRFGGG